jgi:hypothetical protein
MTPKRMSELDLGIQHCSKNKGNTQTLEIHCGLPKIAEAPPRPRAGVILLLAEQEPHTKRVF